MKKLTIIVVVFVVLYGVWFYIKLNVKQTIPKDNDTVSTTTPVNISDLKVTLSLGESVKVDNVTIKPLIVTEDSRCASDVTCFWAGRIRVSLSVDTPSTSTVDIEQGKTLIEKSLFITLDNVLPYPISTKTITDDEYKFFFTIKKLSEVSPTESKKDTGKLLGQVTLSPVCPVERIPPDPDCAPKPYQTKIEVLNSSESEIIKTIQSGIDGNFEFTLPIGEYVIQAVGGNPLPRCSSESVIVKVTSTTSVDLSCDTGIR